MLKDIVLFGAQGSGKGTQAKKLVEHFMGQYRYFESGAVLRALESNDNAIGSYIRILMEQGKLIHDALVVSLFDAFYVTLRDDQKMIVDGFPRDIPQMHSFLDRMYRNKRELIGIRIDVPKEIAVERAMQRGRPDDTRESVENRISTYYEQTTPIIEYIEHFGTLVKIDGTKSVEEVFQDILNALRDDVQKAHSH
ncbi:nucleoside monophosphate kinase [Patescibacteria group bacterium]|nr:nucleoside monophosphate kinase [Patescibacteria group bacterium]